MASWSKPSGTRGRDSAEERYFGELPLEPEDVAQALFADAKGAVLELKNGRVECVTRDEARRLLQR